jgi:predicted nucleic acid-binding protein
MNVLVDTSIWSLALRRTRTGTQPDDREKNCVTELRELINEMRAQIIGPIRQELLSGIASQAQFEKLKDYLRPFQDLPVNSIDYEHAAELFNLCRNKGIRGSHIDFLICAIAERYDIPIFTTDKDFALYAEHIDITLHEPRKRSRQ